MTLAAVLTGDLIGSSRSGADAIDRAMATLSEASGRIATWTQSPTLFTRFRGDGWQICLQSPGLSLRASLYLAARLRASGSPLQTRISVGFGQVDSLGSRDLADAHGAAFQISGHGLDDMPRGDRFAIHGDARMQPFLSAIFALTEFQSGRWSQEQAEAIAMTLDQRAESVEDLARQLGITRQAMQARLKGAGARTLAQALAAVEGYDLAQGASP